MQLHWPTACLPGRKTVLSRAHTSLGHVCRREVAQQIPSSFLSCIQAGTTFAAGGSVPFASVSAINCPDGYWNSIAILLHQDWDHDRPPKESDRTSVSLALEFVHQRQHGLEDSSRPANGFCLNQWPTIFALAIIIFALQRTSAATNLARESQRNSSRTQRVFHCASWDQACLSCRTRLCGCAAP